MRKMKMMAMAAAVAVAATASAAVATVQEAGRGARSVTNSGTGVMPAGAQEAMPRTARQIEKNGMAGVGTVPFMFAVVPDLQFPSRDFDVGGLKLNLLCGECVNLDGLDFGLAGIARNHANGWMFNAVNVAYGDGVGLGTGAVNWVGGDFRGCQIGFANWADSGDVFQFGFYNGVRDAQGFQFGLINTADRLQGLQIGFVNIIAIADMSFFPFVNGCF